MSDQYAGEMTVVLSGKVDPMLDELREGIRGLNNFEKEANKVKKAVATPEEAHFARADRLRKLVGAPGGIDRDEYQRALKMSREQMQKETEALDENVKRRQRIREQTQQQNRLEARANAMWMRRRSLADWHTEELQEANFLYQRGLHTEIQHEQVVRDINDEYQRRANMLNGGMNEAERGANRMNFAIAQLAIAGEDAATVWGTNGFGGAMRAASNNLSQAVMVMTSGTNRMWLGSVVGIGAVLAGTIVPKVWEWATGTKKQLKLTDQLKQDYSDIARSVERAAKIRMDNLKFERRMDEVRNIGESDDAKNRIKDIGFNTEEQKLAIQEQEDLLRRRATTLMNSVLGPVFDKQVKGWRDQMKFRNPELLSSFDNTVLTMKKRFLTSIANKEDIEQVMRIFRDDLEALQNQARGFSPFEGRLDQITDDVDGYRTLMNDFSDMYNEINDAQNRIKENEKELIETQKMKNRLIKEEQAQQNKEREAEAVERRESFKSVFEAEQYKMLTEAERTVYDIQRKRFELMEKATGFEELEAAKALGDQLLINKRIALEKEKLDMADRTRPTAVTGGEGSIGDITASVTQQLSDAQNAQEESAERLQTINDTLQRIEDALTDDDVVQLKPIGGF